MSLPSLYSTSSWKTQASLISSLSSRWTLELGRNFFCHISCFSPFLSVSAALMLAHVIFACIWLRSISLKTSLLLCGLLHFILPETWCWMGMGSPQPGLESFPSFGLVKLDLGFLKHIFWITWSYCRIEIKTVMWFLQDHLACLMGQVGKEATSWHLYSVPYHETHFA